MSKNITIVDRVVERLKAQPIGDLIKDEDLYDILKEAIPKVFFEKQVIIKGDGYNRTTTEKDAAIYEIMRELLKERAAEIAKEQLTVHADKIAEMWKTILDQGLIEYANKLQSDAMTAHLRQVLEGLHMRINQDRQKMGLPYI